MAVKVEVPASRVSDANLAKKIRDDLFAVLSIHADVELVELGTLPRSEVGKALRVVDLRPKE
jgi:phenylacetate-coenzyme A ligase PaaK-like adenylate-forming protein